MITIHLTTFARHPLPRIAAAALAATTITWLGGLLFGPVAETRARQLAAAMQPAPAVASATAGVGLASTEGMTGGLSTPSAGRG